MAGNSTVDHEAHAAGSTLDTHERVTEAGQRRINLIWETTQAFIAITVVLANVIVAVYQGVGLASSREHPVILSSVLFLVVGFYFGRTNHTAIGGVGRKSSDHSAYRGR